MKKLFILISLLFCISPVYAAENTEHIYISTESCEAAVTDYVNSDNIDKRLGTPFHIYNSDTYVFPVIVNNEFIWSYSNYIDSNGNETGGVSQAVSNPEKFNELKDGRVYQIIADEHYNIFAVSTDGEKSLLLEKGIEDGCAGIADEDIKVPALLPVTGKTVDILNPFETVITPEMYTISPYTGSALMEYSVFSEMTFNKDYVFLKGDLIDNHYVSIRTACENFLDMFVKYDNLSKNITIYPKY